MANGPIRLDLSAGKIAPIGTPKAFIVHHTGGGGSIQGVLDTLRQRHLGVQYVMDRDGSIYQVGGPGESQMMPGSGQYGSGLSNANTVGMEVIAKDDSDVTPAQVAAARQFIPAVYPNIAVYGHGQVNPGHKQETEGMTIVNALQAKGYTPEQIQAAFLSSIAQGESPGYDVMYGGQKFTDFSRHPHQAQTANGVTSDAAGRYQFLGSTWDELQKKYGYKDFSQANQDAAAWQYAQDIYSQKTGGKGSLADALASGDPARMNAAAQILNQTWSSLPGGKEQSKGYGSKSFADVFQGYLGKGGAAAPQGGSGTPVAGTDDPGRAALAALAAGQKDDKKHNWMTAVGEGLSGMGGAGGAMKFAPTPQMAGEAPRVDAPAVSPLVGQDPNKRQYLAQLMAQLNSGRLFG